MDDWQYDDIPISKHKIITEPNPVTGEIKQITEIAEKVTEDIIQTKSNQIRNALIDLGWTPPEEDRAPESMLPPGFNRDHWLERAAACEFYGRFICEYPLNDLLALVAYSFANSPHLVDKP